jgi:microcystin-dependent protein
MSTPYLGEIRIFSFNFAPRGWASANGQLLAINQNQALFAVLGTTYGGNGTQTFALPNFQSKAPVHAGAGYVLGQTGGEANHTLLVSEMPSHTHTLMASTAAADQSAPSVDHALALGNNAYNTASTGAMSSIGLTGSSQPHNNMPPYLVLTFAIALQGLFPSRN